jgi:hypothetical protein
MNVQNRLPIFAPHELLDMPKADLADLLWEMAALVAGTDDAEARKRAIMTEWAVHRGHDPRKRLPRSLRTWPRGA